MKILNFKFRYIIFQLLLISVGISISAQTPQPAFKNGNNILLGPWKCRSAATSNKWIDGGFYPRANDLFGPLKWDDTSIQNNAKLGEMDWNFQTTFHLPSKKYLHYRLHLGQSAIYDQIRLNNIAINCNRYLPAGMASFCGFEPDLYPSLLKDSNNVLRLNHFTPFDPERRNQYAIENSTRIKDNDTSGFAAAVRVPPYQSGWDIAPRRITAGLDEGVYLEGWNHYHVNHISIQTMDANEDSAKVLVKFVIETDQECRADLQMIIWEKDQKNIFDQKYIVGVFTELGYPLDCGINTFTKILTFPKPKLWWPNGSYQQLNQTKPQLYSAQIGIMQPGDSTFYSLDFGIRTIKLIQEKDKFGESFYFKINNKPVFIKGINLVPTRGFMTKNMHDSLWKSGLMMKRIQDANVNMVRVWGGGGYEDDWFYHACDSLGIMVWQDFMYSGMMYASRYDQDVEAQYHVNRLTGHPCLALWCGNNEIAVAWKNWGWQNKYDIHGNDSAFLWKEYKKIFYEKLPTIVRSLDKNIIYIPSSPVSNWGNKKGYARGDNHYWGVWHGEQSVDSLKTHIPRFASEWGLPSYPLSGFKGAGIVEPDSITMVELDDRMLSYKGANLLHKYVDSFYSKYPDLPFTSQYAGALQMQSNAIALGIQAHRYNRNKCMGTMWWQYNDVWPGTTWSIMDYSGQPKPAYYSLKYNFENLHVFREMDEFAFILKGVNDGWSDSAISIGIYNSKNLKSVLKTSNFPLKKTSSAMVLKINYNDLNKLCNSPEEVLIIQATCNGRKVATFRYNARER